MKPDRRKILLNVNPLLKDKGLVCLICLFKQVPDWCTKL